MKRAWMLLLAVIALVALMAIPAMAAECCGNANHCHTCGTGHEGWSELPAGETTISATGNYFLKADSVAAGITITGKIEVTICLNGKEWTNPDSSTRPLCIKEGATVNIVDCSAQSAISETDSTLVSAGAIISTVDRSGESTGEAGKRTNTMGGAIYISGDSELNIYNGTIDGGYVYSGGTIYMTGTNTKVNIYGGHITGGKARVGGNIYMVSGVLTVDGVNAVISCGETTRALTIEDPATSKTDDYDPNGGNVYNTGGTMNLKNGLIRDGAACGTAGNVRIGNVFNMSGGTIRDGVKITNEATNARNTTDGAANMQIVGSQSHVISGGTITGHVSCYKTVKFTVSGDVILADLDENGHAVGGISLHGSNTAALKADTKLVIGAAGLGDNAVIALGKAAGYIAVDKPADAAKWAEIVQYYKEGKLRGYGTNKLTLEAADASTEKAEALYIRAANASGARYSCICGANPGEEHIGGCDAYAVAWQRHDLTGSNTMPSSAGYYYLIDNDGTADNAANVKRVNPSNKKIYVDFNGVTVTQGTIGTQNDDKIRFGYFWCNSTTAPMEVVYMDSSQGHVGSLVVSSEGKKTTGTYDHSNIWLRMPEITDKKRSLGVTMSCYRLSVDCSQKSNSYGTGISVGTGTVLNLYECDLIGGTAKSGGGSAIFNDGGTVTIIGGSITGTKAATSGGAIYNANKKYEYKVDGVVKYTEQFYGRMTLRDVTITGGEAKNGGAIYSAAELTIDNCVINGSTVTENGGGIYNTGKLTITNSNISGGFAVNGATIYTKAAEVSIADTTITGGTASTSGAGIYNEKDITLNNVTINGGTANISGGAVYTKGGLLQANDCRLNGGTSNSNGATFIIVSSTATLNNCSVTALKPENEGIAAQKGAAIYVHDGTLTVDGGTQINGGRAQQGGAVYMAGGTFNFYSGTISGGEAFTGGNVFMGGSNAKFKAIPNPAGEAQGTVRCIKDGFVTSPADGSSGGNFRVEAGEVTLTGAQVSDGLALYVSDMTFKEAKDQDIEKYTYGGNFYLNTANTSVLINGGSVISGGTVITQYKDSYEWAAGGNIYVTGGATLEVENATITNGQANTDVDNKGVDGKNIYINYGSEVWLRDGAVVSNTSTVSRQENILMQGGILNIQAGSLITAAEGVIGYNIRTNASAISSNSLNNMKRVPVINMTGGTISGATGVGTAAATDGGANVRLSYLATFNMTGGTIKNGVSQIRGANVYLEESGNSTYLSYYRDKMNQPNAELKDIGAKMIISGNAEIFGGTITQSAQNGGSIFVASNSHLTVTGNAKVYEGNAANCGGNIYANGYLTVGGNARIYDGIVKNTSSHPNIFVVGGYLTLQDNAQIAGGVGVTQSGLTPKPFTLKGSPVVDKTLTSKGKQIAVADLAIGGGCYLVIENLAADAQLDLTASITYTHTVKVDGKDVSTTYDSYQVDEATNGYILCENIGTSDVSGLGYDNSSYYLLTDGTKLLMVPKADLANAVAVNGSKMLYNLATAVTKAGTNGLLQLQADCTADNVTIPSGVWVDLNGKTLAGKVTVTGGKLHLLDSVSADYNLEQDENKNYIYGKLTATVNGGVEDSFTTMNQNGYTGNHRYIVLVDKDEDGNMTYHAHRIYLAVKGVVLYPQGPHLRYHTEFKCDQVVAKDAKYGVQISGIPYGATEAKTSTKLYSAAVVGEGKSNSRIAGLTNILVNEDEEVCNYLATMDYTACGYIDVNGQEFTSASYTTTLKDVVEGVDKMWGQGAEGVTETIKPALVEMYETYADIMGGWELTNIKAAAAAKKQ